MVPPAVSHSGEEGDKPAGPSKARHLALPRESWEVLFPIHFLDYKKVRLVKSSLASPFSWGAFCPNGSIHRLAIVTEWMSVDEGEDPGLMLMF